MGVVYRARDERLDRDVALKVLPAGSLADDSARRRFRKEALALAKLSHPNIAVIHDFDTQDGTDFLVMECLSGKTLKEKLAASSFGEKEVVGLGAQIAAALEEAHEQGVIHRDLKPANVLVTSRGQAKVLDFGLAKLLGSAGDPEATQTFTETRSMAGTLPYMAPEQLRGQVLDGRTDIYALGCVLYEMATGRRTYNEDTAPGLTDAILHQSPVSPRAVNPRISPQLETIILKCLEKDPDHRYQSSKELGVDFRRLAVPSTAQAAIVPKPARARWRRSAIFGVASLVAFLVLLVLLNVGGVRERLFNQGSAPRIRSLAVLPLENLSHDPDQEYFADGMTEQLITNLAQISALKVISRTSVMQYKGARMPLAQIAKELGVDTVVEGSVQRSGNRVRITAQLIEASTDRHIWARPYERDLRDVLDLQDELARTIAGEIRVRLTPQEQTRLASARPVDPAAHDAYLLGRFHTNKHNGPELDTAIEDFQKAIQVDPGYALAYAGLARAYSERDIWGGLGLGHSAREVRAATQKALELDPGIAEAHLSLGYVHFFYDWDWLGAEAEFRRAIELNPNLSEAHIEYAFYLQALGHDNEAIASAHRGVELDPISAANLSDEGRILHRARRYDQAIVRYKRALEIDPVYRPAFGRLAEAYEMTGEFQQAVAVLERIQQLGGGGGAPDRALGSLYARMNRRAEALQIVHRIEKEKGGASETYAVATIYAALGDKDRALNSLERGVRERSLLPVVLRDPKLDPLRGEPRFQALLRRAGLPP